MKYQVDMLIDGKIVRKISYRGKTYLPVSNGKSFQLRITNKSCHRVCAVVSVDGLSVMNGKSASHNDSGYIINPWCSETIDGWRRGSSEVAAFEISTKGQSYAAKTDRPKNVGVIGVVVFPEVIKIGVEPPYVLYKPWKSPPMVPDPNPWIKRHPYIPQYPQDTLPGDGIIYDNAEIVATPTLNCNINSCVSNSTQPSNKQSRGISGQSVGTAYGEKLESHITTVSFERDENKKQVIVLCYDTAKALRAKGVPLYEEGPNPFPEEDSEFYCPEPL